MEKRKSLFKLKSLIVFVLALLTFVGCNPSASNQKDIAEYQKVKHVEWSKNLSIYEANIRQYTPEGTFNAFAEHLPRIKELGTDIIWLMPIYPIGEKFKKATQTTLAFEVKDPKKSEKTKKDLDATLTFELKDSIEKEKYLGSYYSIKDYLSVNQEFGTIEDFKALVEKIHELNMYVILDIAANHTSWDHDWITTHPEYYTKIEEGTTPWNPEWMEAHPEYFNELIKTRMTYPIDQGETDWWDTADLNFDNDDLRNEFKRIFKYWVEEYNVDGYRCDVAGMVPFDFWKNIRLELDKIKPVFMLAEAWEPELHENGFDMTYAWGLHHIFNEIAQGKKTVQDLVERLEKEKTDYNFSDYRMTFTSNHDENSWNGSVSERMGDATKAFAVLSITMPGMPLIYSGQEACLDKKLLFFEKDSINWEKECCMQDLYAALLKLKKENPALWNGDFGGAMERITTTADNKIFAFSRTKDDNQVITILNLSPEEVEFELTNPNNNELTELFTDEVFSNNYKLEAWGYKVFK